MTRRLPPSWIALSPGVLERGAGAGDAAVVIDAFVRAVHAAVAGGLRAVLLREPGLEDGAFLELARGLRAVLDAPGIEGWLGIHDRLHLVQAAGADGAHVGGRSLPVAAARRVLGADIALGVSTHADDLEGTCDIESTWAGADVALHAPVFAPLSKLGSGADAHGPEGLRVFAERCTLPVWALGGVTEEGLSRLAGSGAAGACTIGALWKTTASPITSHMGPLGDLAGIEERARGLSTAVAATFGEVPRA